MNRLTILFVLTSIFLYSQKKEYSFDYAFEYVVTLHLDSISYNRILLTNSKDNSYYVILKSIDSTNFELKLIHQDKLSAKVEVLKSGLNTAEFVNISCENIYKLSNKYKYQTKNYEFKVLNDTNINGKKYALYKLESHEKLKRKIRKGIGINYYIIEPNTDFHAPILVHPTAYEEWKLNKSIIPYGIFKEIVFINSLNQLHSSKKVIQYYKIDKNIIFDGDCSHLD